MAKSKAKDKLNIVNIVSRSVEGNVGVTKWEDNDCKTIAFLIPRSKIYDIKFTSPGLRYNSIYFLFGYEEHNGKKIEMVYVGQATEGNDNRAAIRRIIQHDKAYNEDYHDYWDMAVIVTNESTKWTVADLYALEHAFCNIIDKDILWNKDNPNSGGADYAQYEAKIHDIKRLITAIGYNLFKYDNEQIQIKEELDTNELGQKVVEDLHNGMSRIPEIVTPLKVVRQMCNMLPEEVWNDKTVFLDPACKGGEYLREIYDRLMRHPILVEKFTSEIERSNHILGKQLYGIALSQTSLERTRRALLGYDNNIKIIPGYLALLKGKIELTKKDGTKKTIKDKLDEEFGIEMKIDVVIGNPPYQEKDDGGRGSSAIPIYDKFIDMAVKVTSKYVSFITPSKWFSGGRGLDDFRERMLKTNKFVIMHDFPIATHVFNGVRIAGGVNYFLYDNEHSDNCEIVEHNGDKISSVKRPLLENGADTFIRMNSAVTIFRKTRGSTKSFSDITSRVSHMV